MGASFPLANPRSNALGLYVADSYDSQVDPASAPSRLSSRKDPIAGMKQKMTPSRLLTLHPLSAQEVALTQKGLRTSLGGRRACSCTT